MLLPLQINLSSAGPVITRIPMQILTADLRTSVLTVDRGASVLAVEDRISVLLVEN